MSANLAGREYFFTISSFTTHGQPAVDPGLCDQDLMNSLTSSFVGVLFILLRHANEILYLNAKTKKWFVKLNGQCLYTSAQFRDEYLLYISRWYSTYYFITII